MAIAKVILNGVTQMDVTGKTVTAGSMLSGTTALKNDGTDITGDIESKTSSDLTASGATVTAPAGYYASAASKSVASGSAGTPTASKGTVSNHSVSITPSVTNTTGYITGGTKTGTAVTVSASELVSGTKTITASGTTDVTNYESVSVASGSAKTPATTITEDPYISVDASGLIRAFYSKTQNVTPSVSAGYVSSGTAGTITVSGSSESQLTKRVGQIIHPSTNEQSIASGTYITGTQTINAVRTTNLIAGNIVNGVTVKIGDVDNDDCVASVTGKVHTSGYVATITRTGSGTRCRVTYDGVNYPHDSINTFLFSSGDVLRIISTSGLGGAEIYIDGVRVATSGQDSSVAYNYTLPENYINILMEEGNEAKVYVTTQTLAITENGTYDVSDYGKAEVNVASGGGGLDASYKAVIQRDNADVTLPDDLTKVGDYAFYGGRNLRITSLPSGITTIGSYAFGNTAINVTSLPDSITTIGTSAFYGCSNLVLTSLPSGITTIPQYCFQYCSNLALTSLPSGVTGIGNSAFYGCSNLALTSLPSGVQTINSSTFYDCYAITLTSLPDGVTTIAASAFAHCEGMTSISCNGTITTMGNYAFNGSNSHQMRLAHASFPNMAISSLTTVFGSATTTYACRLLEDADIGNTAAIAANAFANCNKLQTIIIRKSNAICTLANISAFTNTPIRGYNDLSGTIYVPSALISTYQTATNWATVYAEGHVTFAAIEGSQYEL